MIRVLSSIPPTFLLPRVPKSLYPLTCVKKYRKYLNSNLKWRSIREDIKNGLVCGVRKLLLKKCILSAFSIV